MKTNVWVLSLAAMGVASFSSVIRADEKNAPGYLETAASGTSISGYVNTSAQWNVGNNGQMPSYGYGQANNASKADGFNLDATEVTISKQLDDSQWASGYNFTMVYGQDAPFVGAPLGGTNSLASIKDAYVELRAPVGNGIAIKAGVFDTLLGYEVFDAGSNPNYTHSYGYAFEPKSHTGVLAAYDFAEWFNVQAGVGNTTDTGLGTRNGKSSGTGSSTIESKKAYYGAFSLTAPKNWGFLAGSTLKGAVEGGRDSGSSQDQINYSLDAVINTPVKGLKVGAAYDYAGTDANEGPATDSTTIQGVNSRSAYWADATALYCTYQATDKLSFDGRAEYAWIETGIAPVSPSTGGSARSVYALTGTVEYDLWKDVMSRAEIRWDHANTDIFGDNNSKKDSVLLAANIIYKF
jgi:hypothetical protein